MYFLFFIFFWFTLSFIFFRDMTYLRFLYCTRHSHIASCTYLICNATRKKKSSFIIVVSCKANNLLGGSLTCASRKSFVRRRTCPLCRVPGTLRFKNSFFSSLKYIHNIHERGSRAIKRGTRWTKNKMNAFSTQVFHRKKRRVFFFV